MADRVDPYRSYRFSIEIDGITEAYFTEVVGIEASFDVIEFRSGDMSSAYWKLPGLFRNTTVTLKQGVTDNMELWEWFKTEPIMSGAIERKDVTVKAVDDQQAEVAVWTFYDAWPCKYISGNFNASESGVLIESVELAYEGFMRSK
ncbi:MAG: phage tail protein [Syntrophomonadaceae bacterium]|nr:phage tail protein [Syntrophomonadaceae bacterium]